MKWNQILLRSVFICALLTLTGFSSGMAQGPNADTTNRWEPYRFLLGNWVADTTANPSAGSGEFSFTLELSDNILVRKNHAVVSPGPDKPPASHDDLMIIFQDRGQTRAGYWDNEGHAITYAVSFNAANDTLSFVSDLITGAPRFRLQYIKLADGGLKITFDFAPPGQPEAFSPYLQGTAHRK